MAYHEILTDTLRSIFAINCQSVNDTSFLFGYIYFDNYDSDTIELKSETDTSYIFQIPEQYKKIIGSQFNVGLLLDKKKI